MKWTVFITTMLLAATAQAQPAATLPMPSAVPLQAEQLPSVSLTQPVAPPPPFTVDGVVVKLDESEGFNRDMALTNAARQGLPVALGQLEPPMPAAKAAEVAKSIGEPLALVKSYKIVKEVLVPAYQLTVNLLFDGAKLQTNFGSTVKPVDVVPGTVDASGTSAVYDTSATAPLEMGEATTVVEVETDSAQAQDALFGKLAAAGFKPQWTLLRHNGGAMALTTALEGEALAEKLRGFGLVPDLVDGSITLRP